MKKLINNKIFIILIMFIFISIFNIKIYATNVSTNSLNGNTTNPIANEEENENNQDEAVEENNNSNTTKTSSSKPSYVTSVSPVSSQYESNLTLNNVLSIILISIGILLIILAIAILIKLK